MSCLHCIKEWLFIHITLCWSN